MQLDALSILSKPLFPFRWQVVTGCVVDDEEDLATSVLRDEASQERPEGLAVEHVGKPVGEIGIMEPNRRKEMRGLSQSECVDPWLAAHPRPGSVECAIQPEAGFVLEEDYAVASCGFFLIRGKVVRIQRSCRWRSARASRLRGRCTENPSLCSSGGM